MNEEHLIERASEERRKIFERYDRGRSAENQIDPWEDPSFEIYHQTDKYGFIHDQRLTKKVTFQQETNLNIQMEREKKWLQMLNRWNKKDTLEKLKKRIYKGIPNKLRPAVWLKLLNIDEQIEKNHGIYKKMLAHARQWSTEARQIDSDVNRQFREHLCYRERYSVKQQSLFNVLTAYSMYNMEVGYCQGMAGVAGILLMYMDEEQAFWALNTFMINRLYAMHGLFIEGFPKLTRFLAHHDRIIAKFLPKLHKHFIKHNLDSVLYSLKWFFVIFVERIPFSLCLRIWDIYMIEGERVITAMAFTILYLNRNKLLKMKDMDLMTDLLQTQLHRDFGYHDDNVIRVLEQSMADLKRFKMDLPPPPSDAELPRLPLGRFIEPDYETKIGRRKSMFTDNERKTTETIIMRQDSITPEVVSNFSYDNTDENMAEGSIRTYQSYNSLATSVAISNACIILEDSSSMRSSSVARTSIASTSNNDWSEDNHSNSLEYNGTNQDIFLKTANDIFVSPRNGLVHRNNHHQHPFNNQQEQIHDLITDHLDNDDDEDDTDDATTVGDRDNGNLSH